MRVLSLALALSAALFAASCQHGSDGSDETRLAEDGHAIAQAQCASCHAVGYVDESPRADAPPLREISRRYRFPVLEEELLAGIKLGHPSMPAFQFSPRGADALIAYLRRLQLADPERPAKPE